MYIPQLGKYAESILENGSSNGRKLATLQRIARQAVAALCALGGFKETIKIGSEVQVGRPAKRPTVTFLLPSVPALPLSLQSQWVINWGARKDLKCIPLLFTGAG